MEYTSIKVVKSEPVVEFITITMTGAQAKIWQWTLTRAADLLNDRPTLECSHSLRTLANNIRAMNGE